MKEQLRRVLTRMEGLGALVVGDLYLDEYLVGRPSKISREAPVMVLDYVASYSKPGGGAAPAVNIATLRGKAYAAGVVGDDDPGRTLLDLLSSMGVDVSPSVVCPDRRTTRKLRIVAEGSLRFPQQLLRLDFQERRALDASAARELVGRAEAVLDSVQLVLVSDYLSGVATEDVVRSLRELADRLDKITVADSQGALHKYRGYSLVKCNREEAARFLGKPLSSIRECSAAAKELASRLQLTSAVITLGQDGLVVADVDRSWHVPALKRVEVYDVTGAGDAVVAVAGMAVAAGANLLEAAVLANLAGGAAVQRWGNAPVTREDLEEALEHWDGEIFEDPDRG